MKKLLISLGFAVAAFTLLPATVSADSYTSGDDWTSDSSQSVSSDEDWNYNRCDRIDRKLDRLQTNFDQDNDHRLSRQQNLIDRSNDAECPVAGTIVDTLAADGNFSTLIAAVQAAGLVDALNTPGDKTLFAPTDQAFAKLPAGTVESLVGDIPALTAILTNHVVAGNVDAETAATLTTATALNGKVLTISSDDCELYINDSRVVLTDIMTSNGIIHVIDTVITQ